MSKSRDAFRTISEVADWLGIQAHVLRFWESKFTQVRPVKRAGGRRYYRPGDMLLLGGIKQLLHEDGLTIKGVQKILREEGMSHVSAMSQPLDELTQSLVDEAPESDFIEAAETPPEEKGVVLNFETTQQKTPQEAAIADVPEVPQPPKEPASKEQDVEAVNAALETTVPDEEPMLDMFEPSPSDALSTSEPDLPTSPVDEPQADAPHLEEPQADAPFVQQEIAAHEIDESVPEQQQEPPAPELQPEPQPETVSAEPEPAENVPELPVAQTPPAPDASETPPTATSKEADVPEDAPETASLPAFLRRPMSEQSAPSDNPPAQTEAPLEPEPPTPAAPKPRVIPVPAFTPEHEIAAEPATLASAYRTRQLTKTQARQIAPLLERLTILRDSMAARRSGATNTTPNT